MRRSTGSYPDNWPEIAKAIKTAAGWKCVRCGHPHDLVGYVLTCHHLDMNPANCEWWNCPALCQKCHLTIQAKVFIEQVWMFEHSDWFKPYVAGYYASRFGYPTDRAWVEAHIDELIALGQGHAPRARPVGDDSKS